MAMRTAPLQLLPPFHSATAPCLHLAWGCTTDPRSRHGATLSLTLPHTGGLSLAGRTRWSADCVAVVFAFSASGRRRFLREQVKVNGQGKRSEDSDAASVWRARRNFHVPSGEPPGRKPHTLQCAGHTKDWKDSEGKGL